MSDDPRPQWTPDQGPQRSRRDTPVRGAVAADVARGGAHVTGPTPAPDSLEAVVQGGPRWLRFPPALEAAFQADTLAPRRRSLIAFGVVGIISIYLGTANIAALNPDIVATAQAVADANLLASLLGLLLLIGTPPRWRRTWQAEGVTAFIALGTCAGLINGSVFSRADTTFTHTAVMVSVVMYTCIVARQRFVWSLGGTLLSFLAYLVLVEGHTPTQQLIVSANINLMSLSFAFVLAANYRFEYRERRHWLLRRLERQRQDELLEMSENLSRLSTQDALTGLLNRRQFDAELATAWSTAAATGGPLALLMVDIDFFKRYNDTYGHPAGDTCLARVANTLASVAQVHGGIAARLGGEEFGMLLPAHTRVQAEDVGAALCAAVRAAGIEHRASTVESHVTVSVGAAQVWPARADAPATLVALADEALYAAKAGGRDRVCATESVADHAATAEAAKSGSTGTAAVPTNTVGAAAAALPADPMAYAATAPYLQTLEGQFRWLRFPAALEADYRSQHATERRRHMTIASLLGLLIYSVYLLSSRAMFPDVPDRALLVLAALGTCLLLLTIVLYPLRTMAPWRREAVSSINSAALAAMTAWMLSQSQELSALSFAVNLVLIPLFAGVAARQPFWFTCVPAVATCAAAVLLLKPVDATQALVYRDSVLMIVNNTVFTLILAYTLDHGARKEWLLESIERLQREALLAATEHLRILSTRDPLTGLNNRRQFDADFQRIWADALLDSQPVALLIIDVDFFKHYNDGYGHPAGDRCLQQLAEVLATSAATSRGLAARLGGEEFCILLPGTSQTQAVDVGERVCEAVREAHIEHRHSATAPHVTVSVGAASLTPVGDLARAALLAAADDALYQAKASGRDRVAAWAGPAAA